MKLSLVSVVQLLALLLATGCTTTQSTRAKPLPATYVANHSLSQYRVATVEPFAVTTSQAANDQVGAKLATDVANRLQYDFGPLFQSVRVGPPLGRHEELGASPIIGRAAGLRDSLGRESAKRISRERSC